MDERINYGIMAFVLISILSGTILAYTRSHLSTKYSSVSISTSYIFPPKVLLLFRTFVFLLFTGTQIYQSVIKGPRTLIFYTTWNFILQAFYFGLVVYYTLRPTVSQKVHVFIRAIFDITLSTSFLVFLVTWAILYPHALTIGKGHLFTTNVSYLQHGGNVILLLLELCGNSFTVNSKNIYLLPIWPIVFCAYAWIIEAGFGLWPYHFLRMDVNGTVIWYIGLLLVHYLFFGVAMVFSTLKKKVLKKCNDDGMELEEEEEDAAIENISFVAMV